MGKENGDAHARRSGWGVFWKSRRKRDSRNSRRRMDIEKTLNDLGGEVFLC